MKQLWEHFLESFHTLNGELLTWVDDFVRSLPNIALALVVGTLGYLFSRMVRKYFNRILATFSKNLTVNRLLANITTVAFMILILFIVLSILNLERALQSLLATAGVAGLAVGLALQEPIINFLSGVIMSTRVYFKVGDLVETNGYLGVIDNINLRSTVIHNFQGQQVVLPNKLVLQNVFINYSISRHRQLEVNCGISYGEDLEKVKEVTLAAVMDRIEYDPKKPLEFFFTEFGESSINFLLRFWLKKTDQLTYLEIRHQTIIALKKAFDENGITIPFPIRTLDFGIKGGTPIGKAWGQKDE
ncbi:MAG: mechanosensitive ion channel family protein [Lewinellaceae bacterium]|nr:mechanosensitive ion channel family protein [Lewinellaceae bacterium]